MDAPFPKGMMEAWAKFNGSMDVFEHPVLFPLQRRRELEAVQRLTDPRVFVEVGADKGGGFYEWVKKPSVQRAAACEVRGTPYSTAFGRLFPSKDFLWLPCRSEEAYGGLERWLDGDRIDVLFLDGDKRRFYEDFNTFLFLVAEGGLVIMHDIQDEMPREALDRVRADGFSCTSVVDASEYNPGTEPVTEYDNWILEWRGRSCGYGIIRV